MAKDYNLIPITRTLLADLETPIRIFRRVAQRERAFLLESVEGGSQWARYSFIGTDPFLTIAAKKEKWCWNARAAKKRCVRRSRSMS
ncbi:hypothetical protein HMSSN036_04660 [Paenibacillus macerans]|nr:hypothetical protein HMSSN036_04660 [Paenibacillus macerans]